MKIVLAGCRHNFVRPFHIFPLTAAQFHQGNGNVTQLMYTVSLDHISSTIQLYICEPSPTHLIAKCVGSWESTFSKSRLPEASLITTDER